MRLFVVGSLHLDVVVHAPHLPALDETLTGSRVEYLFGGKGGNQAVAAARMGATVSFAGRAGSDGFGDILRAELQSNGVDCVQLQRDKGPSGMSAAIIDANGDYGAVIVSAANLLIDAAQIEIPTGTSLVLLQNEVPEAVNLKVARKARLAEAKVWLNAAPARGLSDDLLALVDLMIVNRVEAEFYGALDKVPTLKTLGAEGVVYNGERFQAHDVEMTSTHGAGDMFAGALAAQVVGGATMTQAIEFAQAAAGLYVSLPTEKRGKLTADRVARFRST